MRIRSLLVCFVVLLCGLSAQAAIVDLVIGGNSAECGMCSREVYFTLAPEVYLTDDPLEGSNMSSDYVDTISPPPAIYGGSGIHADQLVAAGDRGFDYNTGQGMWWDYRPYFVFDLAPWYVLNLPAGNLVSAQLEIGAFSASINVFEMLTRDDGAMFMLRSPGNVDPVMNPDDSYNATDSLLRTISLGNRYSGFYGVYPFNNASFCSNPNPRLILSYDNTSPVPEPATCMLLGSGLLALAGFARRKMRG